MMGWDRPCDTVLGNVTQNIWMKCNIDREMCAKLCSHVCAHWIVNDWDKNYNLIGGAINCCSWAPRQMTISEQSLFLASPPAGPPSGTRRERFGKIWPVFKKGAGDSHTPVKLKSAKDTSRHQKVLKIVPEHGYLIDVLGVSTPQGNSYGLKMAKMWQIFLIFQPLDHFFGCCCHIYAIN